MRLTRSIFRVGLTGDTGTIETPGVQMDTRLGRASRQALIRPNTPLRRIGIEAYNHRDGDAIQEGDIG